MTISKKAQEQLRTLADLVMQTTETSQDLLRQTLVKSGFKQAVIPESVLQAEAHELEPGQLETTRGGHLIIVGEEWRQYRACLASLVAEPELEHLKSDELDAFLWELVCDLAINKTSYRSAASLRDRMKAFRQTVTRPHQSYEVMIGIQGMQLSEDELVVGTTRLLTLDPEFAEKWGIFRIPKWFVDPTPLIGGTVAIVLASGGTIDKAVERARSSLSVALDAVRIALLSWKYGAIDDSFLRFSQSDVYVVRSAGQPETAAAGWHLQKSRSDCKFSAETFLELKNQLQTLAALHDGTIAGNLGAAVSRAASWIATSASRDQYDDKVVDLCTALECLLTTRSDPRKAEAVALRVLLLSFAMEKPSYHPWEIQYLYEEARSNIVHGTDRGICGERHYAILRSVALSCLANVAELVRKEPQITQLTGLHRRIEQRESLDAAVTMLNRSTDKWSQAVKQYAESRLAITS